MSKNLELWIYTPSNKIANVFFKAGFIDTWGRGFQKIRDVFEADGIPMPKVENFCGGVRVTIERTVFVKLSVSGQTGGQTGSQTSSQTSDVTSSVTSLSLVILTERQQVILGIIHRFVVEHVVEGCRRGWRRDSFSTLYC